MDLYEVDDEEDTDRHERNDDRVRQWLCGTEVAEDPREADDKVRRRMLSRDTGNTEVGGHMGEETPERRREPAKRERCTVDEDGPAKKQRI